jgi:hypothetical protein
MTRTDNFISFSALQSSFKACAKSPMVPTGAYSQTNRPDYCVLEGKQRNSTASSNDIINRVIMGSVMVIIAILICLKTMV